MRPWVRVAVAGAVLVAGIVLQQFLARGEAVPLRRSLEELPLQIGPHRGVEEGLEPEIITKLGVTEFIMRRYRAAGSLPVWLYVGYYASQRTGVIIHSPQQCLPGAGWSILTVERTSLAEPGPTGSAITVNRVLVGKERQRQVVLYWYQERGRVVASEYWGRAYLVWDSITRNRTDGALVRISVPVAGSEADAHRQALEFAQRVLPLLTEFLPG